MGFVFVIFLTNLIQTGSFIRVALCVCVSVCGFVVDFFYSTVVDFYVDFVYFQKSFRCGELELRELSCCKEGT